MQVVGASFLFFAVPRVIANFVDPTAKRVQRSVFNRFWTVTVPDNAVFFAAIWLGRFQWQIFQGLFLTQQLATITVLAILILLPAKAVELIRLEIAKGFDWISRSNKIPRTGRDVAFFLSTCIGPRDFYALNSDKSRPLFGADWLVKKMGFEDSPKGSQFPQFWERDPLLAEASLREASARGERLQSY